MLTFKPCILNVTFRGEEKKEKNENVEIEVLVVAQVVNAFCSSQI